MGFYCSVNDTGEKTQRHLIFSSCVLQKMQREPIGCTLSLFAATPALAPIAPATVIAPETVSPTYTYLGKSTSNVFTKGYGCDLVNLMI